MPKQYIFTKNVTPYMVGDVATFTDDEVAAIEGQVLTPEQQKDRDLKANPLMKDCVEEFDPKNKKHAEALLAQRGKEGDVTPEAAADNDARVSKLQADLDKANAERDAAQAELAKNKPSS